ncbi:SDR family oxidoreductase [Actibacterium pelagium]|uniref:Short-chain dehydrogenase n=1 Tax=Actibacterium pelagium TaxID=2029103 RepID=A0A917EK04_9RHOB|nr:SDR family oxidoreductase [Actibacterium pelagium]GGE55067.1 short-chain dehydrogenase [Actibacterium pelagium]
MIPADSPVLILGARSDMARALAHEFAKEGHPLMLAARNADTLSEDMTDLEVRFQAKVTAHDFDILDVDGHAAFLGNLPEVPAVVVSVVGFMGDQDESAINPDAARKVIDTNFTAPCLMLELCAGRLAELKRPTAIIGIGSVAGDRGRAKNYVYGAAKAGFATWLSGMRQKYVDSQLHIMTVKPGFVRTSATADMDLLGPLTDEPEAFAKKVMKALKRKSQVYYDIKWRAVMGVITHLPERIFMKTKF